MSGPRRYRVTIVGATPPPIGGVTRSVASLVSALQREGYAVRLAHPKRPWPLLTAAVLSCFRKPDALIVNVTTPLSAIRAKWVASIVRSRYCTLIVHGTQIQTSLQMWNGAPRNRLGAALRAFDEVWVNNRDQEANFRAAVPKATIVTVSPFHGETVTVARPARPAGTPIRCVVAEGVTHDALIERGTNVASDAVALLRQRDVAAELIIVLYGGDADAITERSAELRNRCTELRINLSEGEVSALLEDTDVLLRPRDIDGDSILVREALARGCRVVASDGIPRPKGCELVPVEAAAIADALEHGGPVSDGSAMGITALNALANALAERS